MHDEFSAILRTYYDSFAELIEIGVKQNDSHPAGVQVFIYYWIKLFGLNEASLKFPFILMGTLSVYLVYLVGKQWYGKSSAILSALVFAVIQFAIFHSQLARPYSPGLFFVLLSTYFWTKLVFEKNSKRLVIFTYILSASLASYVHAFTLFFVFLQGISGLFFLKKKDLRNYVLINLLVFILYLPHMSIFLAQIGRGDIGGWLGEPDVFFLVDFTKYVFNYCFLFIVLVFGIGIILPFFSKNHKQGLIKFRSLSLGWFFVTYLLAHVYSVLRSPIIQYSTLLFVFPFLLLFVFSFIGEIKMKLKIPLLSLILFVGLYSLIVNRQHYDLMYNQGFDGIIKEVSVDSNSQISDDVSLVLQAPEHRMFDYYLDKDKLEIDYYPLNNNSKISEIVDYLNMKNSDNLFFGWADYANLEYLEFFKHRYKSIKKQKQFFNSEYYLFSNKDEKNNIELKEENYFKVILNYKAKKPGYSKPLEIMLDTMNLSENDILNIKANVKSSNSDSETLLVFDLKDKNGELAAWSASSFKKFYLNQDNSCFSVYHSKRVTNISPLTEGAMLKAYIWNRDTSLIEVKDIEFYTTKINPKETGLFTEIP